MKILLVEDSSADAYLFKGIVEKQADAPDVQWVTDGSRAMDYVRQKNQYANMPRPDVIMLDLNLPRLNGYEMLTRLKEEPELAGIPVIVLTTSRDPFEHSRCMTMGADMCLSKPAALGEYEEMVQRIMSWAALRLYKTAYALSPQS